MEKDLNIYIEREREMYIYIYIHMCVCDYICRYIIYDYIILYMSICTGQKKLAHEAHPSTRCRFFATGLAAVLRPSPGANVALEESGHDGIHGLGGCTNLDG